MELKLSVKLGLIGMYLKIEQKALMSQIKER